LDTETLFTFEARTYLQSLTSQPGSFRLPVLFHSYPPLLAASSLLSSLPRTFIFFLREGYCERHPLISLYRYIGDLPMNVCSSPFFAADSLCLGLLLLFRDRTDHPLLHRFSFLLSTDFRSISLRSFTIPVSIREPSPAPWEPLLKFKPLDPS